MHEIEANRFAYREGTPVPWHIESEDGAIRDNRVPVADCQSFERFMSAANMAVTYEKVPVRLDDVTLSPAPRVPGLFAVRRKEDGLILPNVGVGSRYDILQPVEAFSFFEPFLESGSLTLDTAGILRNGSRFFVNAAVVNSTAEILPGDKVVGYVLFYTSVDGSLVTGIKFVVTRVVCANTQAAALRETGARLRIKHTTGQRVALSKVQEILDVQARSFTATVDQYRRLAGTPLMGDDLRKYVTIALGFPTDAELSTKAENIIETVLEKSTSGLGTTIPGVRGTAWGAFNAVTEYLNHEAGRSEWTRQDSVLFGEYAKTIGAALDLALDLAAVA